MILKKMLLILLYAGAIAFPVMAEDEPTEEEDDPNPCIPTWALDMDSDGALIGGGNTYYEYTTTEEEGDDAFPYEYEIESHPATYTDGYGVEVVSSVSGDCDEDEWEVDDLGECVTVTYDSEHKTDPVSPIVFESYMVETYDCKSTGIASDSRADDIAEETFETHEVACVNFSGSESVWLGIDATDPQGKDQEDEESISASVAGDHGGTEKEYTWIPASSKIILIPEEITDPEEDPNKKSPRRIKPAGSTPSAAYEEEIVNCTIETTKKYQITQGDEQVDQEASTSVEGEIKCTVAKVEFFVSGDNCSEYNEEDPGVFVAVNDTGEYSCSVKLRPVGISDEYNLVSLSGSGTEFFRSGELISSINVGSYKALTLKAEPGLHPVSAVHDISGALDKANVHIIKAKFAEHYKFVCGKDHRLEGCGEAVELKLTDDSYSPNDFLWTIETQDGGSCESMISEDGVFVPGAITEECWVTVTSADLSAVYDEMVVDVKAGYKLLLNDDPDDPWLAALGTDTSKTETKAYNKIVNLFAGKLNFGGIEIQPFKINWYRHFEEVCCEEKEEVTKVIKGCRKTKGYQNVPWSFSLAMNPLSNAGTDTISFLTDFLEVKALEGPVGSVDNFIREAGEVTPGPISDAYLIHTTDTQEYIKIDECAGCIDKKGVIWVGHDKVRVHGKVGYQLVMGFAVSIQVDGKYGVVGLEEPQTLDGIGNTIVGNGKARVRGVLTWSMLTEKGKIDWEQESKPYEMGDFILYEAEIPDSNNDDVDYNMIKCL